MRKVIDAPTFEETCRRVKLILKPLDEETKREFLLPRIKKIYIDYLESQKNNPKD